MKKVNDLKDENGTLVAKMKDLENERESCMERVKQLEKGNDKPRVSSCIRTVFISKHATDHKFLEDIHEDSLQIPR